MSELRIGKRVISTSSEDRVLFPRDGITKGDVIRYYAAVAPYMVPHLRGRRLTMQRYHKNIDEPGIFHKDIPGHFPDWVYRVTVPKAGGGTVTHAVCDNAETLVYIANQGSMVMHTGLSRIDRMNYPDQLIIDLDPPGSSFEVVRSAAFALRAVLQEIEVTAFLKLTGSRGLHVVIPLDRRSSFEAVATFAQALADALVRSRPEECTTEFYKKKRGGKLFVDANRNNVSQTAVPAFTVRALDGAPVAMTISWDELADGKLNARTFNINNACRRLKHCPDPWRDFRKSAKNAQAAHKRLIKLAT